MRYDETDFIEVLGILPEDGPQGHGISRIFDLTEGGLRLLVTVFQYDCDLAVSIFQQGSDIPIITRWARGFVHARRFTDTHRDGIEVLHPLGIYARGTVQMPAHECIRIYLRPSIHLTLDTVTD
jgi:hypothetical protein